MQKANWKLLPFLMRYANGVMESPEAKGNSVHTCYLQNLSPTPIRSPPRANSGGAKVFYYSCVLLSYVKNEHAFLSVESTLTLRCVMLTLYTVNSLTMKLLDLRDGWSIVLDQFLHVEHM